MNQREEQWATEIYSMLPNAELAADVVRKIRSLLHSQAEDLKKETLENLIKKLEGEKQDDSFAQEIKDNYLIKYKDGWNSALDKQITYLREQQKIWLKSMEKKNWRDRFVDGLQNSFTEKRTGFVGIADHFKQLTMKLLKRLGGLSPCCGSRPYFNEGFGGWYCSNCHNKFLD